MKLPDPVTYRFPIIVEPVAVGGYGCEFMVVTVRVGITAATELILEATRELV